MTDRLRAVLVVEGALFHRQLVGQMLGRMGFAPVDLFATPAAALAALQASAYALAVVEYAAAADSGFLRNARRVAHPLNQGLAIVLVTDGASPAAVVNAYAEGAQAVVGRPFSVRALQDRIAQAMSAQGRTPPWAGPGASAA